MVQILVVAANPSDTTRLRLGEEIRAIETALRMSDLRDQFHVEEEHAVRFSDLRSALLRYRPHIVHFCGHGSDSDELILEDTEGNSDPVSTQTLSELFGTLKDSISCVVLNACYSKSQADAIIQHIDCVVGMSRAIGDKDAIMFSTAFYEALGYGRDVKTAFDLGCGAIGAQRDQPTANSRHLKPAGQDEHDEQAIPQLLSARSDPAQIVFANRPSAPSTKIQVLGSLAPAGTIPYTQHELAEVRSLPTGTYIVQHRLSAEDVLLEIGEWRAKRSKFWPPLIDKERLSRNLLPIFVPHWLVNATVKGQWSASIGHVNTTRQICHTCGGKGKDESGFSCNTCLGKGYIDNSVTNWAVQQGVVSASLVDVAVENIPQSLPIHSRKQTADPKGTLLSDRTPADARMFYPRETDSDSVSEAAQQLAQRTLEVKATQITKGLGDEVKDLQVIDIETDLQSITMWLYPIFFGIYEFEGQSLAVEVDGVTGQVDVETPASVEQKETERAQQIRAILFLIFMLVMIGIAIFIFASNS